MGKTQKKDGNSSSGKKYPWKYSQNSIKMMEMMNFDKSTGLGKEKQGINEPLEVSLRPKYPGLGFGSTSSSPVTLKQNDKNEAELDDDDDVEEKVRRYKEEVAALPPPTARTNTKVTAQKKRSPPATLFKLLITPKKKNVPVSLVPYSDDDDDDDESDD